MFAISAPAKQKVAPVSSLSSAMVREMLKLMREFTGFNKRERSICNVSVNFMMRSFGARRAYGHFEKKGVMINAERAILDNGETRREAANSESSDAAWLSPTKRKCNQNN